LPAISGVPAGWSFTNLRGGVEASIVDAGRNGGRALKLASAGGEVSGDLVIKVPVQKNHRYELGGWIKTGTSPRQIPHSAAFSACCNCSLRASVSRRRIRGTRNWTLQRRLRERSCEAISVACILGGAGLAGVAYFDDISLIDLGWLTKR
jgi:hypothetical protein